MTAVAFPPMPHRLPPGCSEDRDRHGNIRVYYRAKGRPKVRLRGMPWTPEFMAEYEAAKNMPVLALGVLARPTLPNTWSWLCLKYFAECSDYKLLDPRTRHVRRQILEATFDELIRPGSDKRFADMPLGKMNANAVEVLRDRKLATPESANGRIKAMRQVFRWGVVKGDAPFNPAREVSYLKSGSEGFRTWTVDEVQRFEDHHPIGTKARLALALLLYTGQRRSDVIRFGKQHVKSGALTFTQFKGRKRKPHNLTLPILPVLQKIIDASPCGDLTFLVNEFAQPFTDGGFGNWFRDRCVEAGVHGRAHGLRKAGATIAANNGATAHQLRAIFGWDTLKEAEKYTAKADQKRLAESAMHLLDKR